MTLFVSPSRRAVVAAAVAGAGTRFARAGVLAASGDATGWRETLVIVRDLAPWIEVLTVVGGWETAHAGVFDAALNALWALPGEARTRQVLMRNRGTRTGFIRLVEVVGAPQQRIRPHDQAWETGGVQALDLRVVDMQATRDALEARGWRGPSDPVRYSAYGVEVIQWAPSSPDGVRLSFIQRIAPPLQGWSELKRWSRVANAAVTVGDMAASDRFVRDGLGLVQASRTDTVGAAGPNVMGLPWALARRMQIDIRGYRGAGDDGAIELISMPEARGRDYAVAAHPPNLGIAGLRVFLRDVVASLARLTAAGGIATAGAQSLPIAPYGRCRVAAARSPDGVWLELVQPLDAA